MGKVLMQTGLLSGIQELQINASVFDSNKDGWDDFEEIEGLLELRKCADWSLRKVEVAINCDGPIVALGELDEKRVVRFGERVRDVLLGKTRLHEAEAVLSGDA